MGNGPHSFVRRFIADTGGVAAVEMALMTPVALAFLSVAVAGGQALTLYHKTVLSAHVVTDMVSRTAYAPDPNIISAELLSSTALDADLALSQLVFYPNDPTNLKFVMTEVRVNAATNTGTVVWSEGYNGATAKTCSTVFNLDPSYAQAGATYLLIGQATFTYQPATVILQVPGGGPNITFNATETLTIRNAPQITVPGVQQQC